MKLKRPAPIAALKRGASNLKQAQREPSLLVNWLRSALIRMWRVRGGGFYGLGFVFTFVLLEIRMVFVELGESDGVVAFVQSQVFELIFRFFSESFGNFIQALVWPLLFLERAGAWGFLVLLIAFLGFDRWVKPVLNHWVPELADVKPSTADSAANDDQ